MRTPCRVLSATLFALLTLSTAAGADWIVLKTGVRMETKGPWKLRGKQVQFTSREGRLQAVRLDEVDLLASQMADGPDMNRPARERITEGREVVIEEAQAVPTPTPLPGGQQLQKFILDPNAPRGSGTLSMGKSTLASIYERYPALRFIRDEVARTRQPGVVEDFERKFENGYFDLTGCYDDDPRESDPDAQLRCLAIVLGYGLTSLWENIEPTPTPGKKRK